MNQPLIDIDDFASVHPELLTADGAFTYYDQLLAAALASIAPGVDGIPDMGLTIRFNHGTYYFANAIVLTKGVTLLGAGGSAEQAGTALVMTNAGQHGITTAKPDILNGNSNGGFYSILQGLYISGPRQTFGAPVAGNTEEYTDANHGIFMNRKLFIRDCYICNFCGNGIEINATTGAPLHENANHWCIENTHLTNNLGTGLYAAAAGDSSSGIAINITTNHNSRWGIYDNSTFGSTYIGCGAYSNIQGAYATRGMENLQAPESTNTSQFINCYVEGDQYSLIMPPAAAIGGNCHADPALNLTVNYLVFGYNNPAYFKSGIASYSRYQPGEALTYSALGGDFGLPSTALVLKANGSPTPGIEKPDMMWNAENAPFCTTPDFLQYKSGWWKMKNSSEKTSFAFSSNKASEGECNFWMPRGFYTGEENSRIKIVASGFDIIMNDSNTDRTDPDSLNPAVRKVGDIVLNTDVRPYTGQAMEPEAQNYAGFICVKDTTDPLVNRRTWAGFGLVQPIAGAPSKEVI